VTDNPLPSLPPGAHTPEIDARMNTYLQQARGNPQRALRLAVVDLLATTETLLREDDGFAALVASAIGMEYRVVGDYFVYSDFQKLQEHYPIALSQGRVEARPVLGWQKLEPGQEKTHG